MVDLVAFLLQGLLQGVGGGVGGGVEGLKASEVGDIRQHCTILTNLYIQQDNYR